MWQKESFFEAAAHIPFLISWPAQIRRERRDDLVCLTDLFGVATGASGASVLRDGIDLLRSLEGDADTRQTLIGMHARPDSPFFKIMVRRDRWKLIYYANGGVRQLFDLQEDPDERCDVSTGFIEVVDDLMLVAAQYFADVGIGKALKGGTLRAEPFVSWEQMLDAQPLRPSGARRRLAQFDRSRGVFGFPSDPSDVCIDTARD
jgi:choline-sulfatase